MRRALKVAGVLLILAGLRSLFQMDWLGFTMFCTLGAGFLIDTKPDGSGRGLKWLLLVVAFVLALVRIASFVKE
jgi:hypothetical protein